MATIKKAQKGIKQKLTPMQKLKQQYPQSDTMPSGDTRFQEFNAYAPKKFQDELKATDAAFDAKYGKGKPAKNKTGGVTKKYQAGGVASKKVKAADKKGDFITVQKRTLKNMKKGGAVKKAQNGDGVFAPMTLSKEQAEMFKNKAKQQRASLDSSKADFNNRLQKAKAKLKPKAKCGTKMSKKK